MKTIQIITCWLGNSKETPQYSRHIRWLDFMDKIQGNLDFSDIWFIDNASDMETLKSLGGEILDTNFNQLFPATTRPNLHIVHFTNFLDRVSVWDYPYVFRAFRFMPEIIKHVNPDRVMFIDTDFYPLTQKMVNKLNEVKSGFIAARDKQYGFLEAALCVLAKDTFNKYFDFCQNSDFDKLKLLDTVEVFMPFTGEFTDIIGGRYGQTRLPQTSDMDYYGQNSGQKMTFDLK